MTKHLNKEIAQIVARQQKFRADIDSIISDMEGEK